MNEKQVKILSIQSHVVSGYVGNKCATFPLQLLGFEVDAINTVQLSNHTGYKVVKGQILNEEDFNQLIDGLVANNLDDYTYLLTGYIGSASFLKRIAEVVLALKRKNPNLVYVCDPVMGDDGRLYVPKEFPSIYKNDIVPLADILTPNQFELELLTGKKIQTIGELKCGMKELQGREPKIVAVSSADIDNKLLSFVADSKNNKLLMTEIPKIPLSFTGSGDLFASLFLAHMHLERDVKVAMEKTINTLHSVLLNTFNHYKACTNTASQEVRKKELQLIQNKKVIENPNIYILANEV